MLGRDCMYDVIVRLFRARGFYGLHAGHKRTPALGHTTLSPPKARSTSHMTGTPLSIVPLLSHSPTKPQFI